jgi:RNA polymerase sigma-70 factor (ECF subfamily)
LVKGGVASLVPPKFEALYAAHAPFVRRVLAKRGVAPADLDDALQETFVTVHRLLPEFEGRSAIETWLYSVAWRTAASYRRRGRRAADQPLPELSGEPDASVSPDRVHASLAKIDQDVRDLLALHEVGGLSISSLSELTGKARETIRSRLDRGRTLLKRALAGGPLHDDQNVLIERLERRLADASRVRCPAPRLRVMPCGKICLSMIDDMMIGVWRGRSSSEGLSALAEVMIDQAELWPNGIRYLSLVERTSSPPTRRGRELTTWIARTLGPKLNAVAIKVDSSALMTLVASTINTSLFLARMPLNVRFFNDMPAALSWLEPHGRLDATAIAEHVAQMRACLDASSRVSPPTGSLPS